MVGAMGISIDYRTYVISGLVGGDDIILVGTIIVGGVLLSMWDVN